MSSIKILRDFFARTLRNWKLLSVRKFLYFPRILSKEEKRFLILLLVITVISGVWLLGRAYHAITKEVPAVGSTYREGALSEPRTINPIYASLDSDRDLERLIFSRLITYSGNGSIKMDLAENYSVSPDGKTYTVALKKNALWHDGVKLTADDVVFTIKTIQNPQYKSPLRANWQGVTIDKKDSSTVVFSLKSPYAQFVENLNIGIIPKHLWERIAPQQAPIHELNLHPVGSGPYRFRRLTQNDDGTTATFEVDRNTKYYGEGPYLKSITLVFFKTENDLIAAWRKNTIDGFGPLSAEHLKEFFEDRVEIQSPVMPRIFGLFFNQKHSSLLAQKSIREAIARALDKQKIARSVALGSATPTDSSLPPVTPGFTADITMYPFSPDTSRTLLDQAGWKDTDGDGIRDKKIVDRGKSMIIPLRLELATSDWPDLVQTAEVVKQSLQAIGIGVNVETHPFSELESNAIRPRNFDMLLFGQIYGYELDPFAFWHSSQIKDPGLNVALYANKKIDKLLEDARKTTDTAARNKNYASMQKIISDDLPAVFLYSQQYLYLLPPDMKGVSLMKISLPSDRFNEVNLWYQDTKRIFK